MGLHEDFFWNALRSAAAAVSSLTIASYEWRLDTLDNSASAIVNGSEKIQNL